MAIAWSSTSAAAGASPALRALELELELARTPELYLLVDPAAARLEIRVRGVALEAIELRDAAILLPRGGAPAALPELPAAWRVARAPEDARRRVVEAVELEPWTEESQEGEAPATPPRADGPEEKVVPGRYRIGLEGDWELRVGPGISPSPLAGSLSTAAARLRAALRGDEAAVPRVLSLAMGPEEARKIHHLFRPGLAVLVTAGPVPVVP